MARLLRAVTFWALSLVIVLASGSQAQEAKTEPEPLITPYTIARGPQVPRYFAVKSFLNYAFDAYQEGEDAFAYNLLRPLEIEPGSRGAQVVAGAMFSAQSVFVEVLDLAPFSTHPAERRAVQVDFHRDRARRISEIYASMLADLRELGISSDTVEGFIDREIVPGEALVSNEPNALETEEVFQVIQEEFSRAMGGPEK
ncbi:MAG: hypothetical protein GY719_05120 [bacterium]|nr:hypothetical protein [bacterium]